MTPDIQELKRLAEAVIAAKGDYTKPVWQEYDYAASPSIVLALIEENERLRRALGVVEENVEASASSYQERVETIGRVVRTALGDEQ